MNAAQLKLWRMDHDKRWNNLARKRIQSALEFFGKNIQWTPLEMLCMACWFQGVRDCIQANIHTALGEDLDDFDPVI